MVAVEDDGRGFEPGTPALTGHFGLATMRERIELVGGQLRVESAPGQGTRIIANLPAPVDEVVEEPAGGKS
jgi:signal transduction histidine kinase